LGLLFGVAALLIVPTTVTLNTWATLGRTIGAEQLWQDHVATTLHVACYVMLFVPAIAWARSRGPLPLVTRAIGYFVLPVVATTLASSFLLSGACTDSYLQLLVRTAVFGLVLCPVLLLAEFSWDRLSEARREAALHALGQERERRAAAEARWTSLESRLHPHFVFNTLASIRELLHRDPPHADRMIQRFADLLRFSLDAPQHRIIPLGEELRMVSAYLQIEQMRLGKRLRWKVEYDETLAHLSVPSLTILSLAENSIKHAIASRRGGGSLTIKAEQDATRLRIEVADDGPGFREDVLPTGHGLQLLRERLSLLYGSTAALTVKLNQPGATVEVLLPAHCLERRQQEAGDDAKAALLRG
jgi:sensor histidine kinase YesM